MKAIVLFLCALLFVPSGIVPAQEGPSRSGSETVATPRKKEAEAEKPKIPSEFKKDKEGQP